MPQDYCFDARYSMEKPSIVLPDRPVERPCKRCGKSFIGMRTQKRCAVCQPIAAAAQQQKAYDKLQARRRAAQVSRDAIRGALERAGG